MCLHEHMLEFDSIINSVRGMSLKRTPSPYVSHTAIRGRLFTFFRNILCKNVHKAGVMAQKVRALSTLLEDPSFIPSHSHMAVYNLL